MLGQARGEPGHRGEQPLLATGSPASWRGTLTGEQRERDGLPDKVPEYIGKKPTEGGNPVVGTKENVNPTDDDGWETAQGKPVPE